MLSNSSIENYFPSALTANTSAQTSTHSLLLAESGGSPSPLKAVDGKADGLKWVRFGAQCSTSASGNNWPCGQGNRVHDRIDQLNLLPSCAASEILLRFAALPTAIEGRLDRYLVSTLQFS